MLDLSEEFDEENIATCVKYFKRMTAINQWLEMEIGITGGEEDGVNNENVDQEKLYTSPQQVIIVYYSILMDYSDLCSFFRLLSDNLNFYNNLLQVWSVHQQLSAIGPMFSIAAAFGNVHGVYKAGNVTLQPER